MLFVSDIAIFVLKRDVKLQLTNLDMLFPANLLAVLRKQKNRRNKHKSINKTRLTEHE